MRMKKAISQADRSLCAASTEESYLFFLVAFFLAAFFLAAFFFTVFLAVFFAVFLAVFLTAFLAAFFFAAFFLAAFFFTAFFAVFLTAFLTVFLAAFFLATFTPPQSSSVAGSPLLTGQNSLANHDHNDESFPVLPPLVELNVPGSI